VPVKGPISSTGTASQDRADGHSSGRRHKGDETADRGDITVFFGGSMRHPDPFCDPRDTVRRVANSPALRWPKNTARVEIQSTRLARGRKNAQFGGSILTKYFQLTNNVSIFEPSAGVSCQVGGPDATASAPNWFRAIIGPPIIADPGSTNRSAWQR